MKYLSIVIVAFSLSFVLWILGIYAQLGMATPDQYWVKQNYASKEAFARRFQEQKVLIVAGSNALFGFDSALLSNAIDKPVVNMGVHAGLGMDYILQRSKRVTDPGDIVIMPMEYTFYQAEGNPSQVLSDFVIAWDKAYFKEISTFEQLQIAFAISYKRFVKGLKMKDERELPAQRGTYSAQNINEYGDQINIEPEKMTAREHSMVKAVIVDSISTIKLSQHFKDTMTAYLGWAKENQVCVIATPPNFMYFDAYEDEKYKLFFQEIASFYKQQGIWYAGDAFSYMFAKEHYFNTRYHLNSVGAGLRTKQLISDLGAGLSAYCENRR